MHIHQVRKNLSDLAIATDKKIVEDTDEVLREINKQNKKVMIRGY